MNTHKPAKPVKMIDVTTSKGEIVAINRNEDLPNDGGPRFGASNDGTLYDRLKAMFVTPIGGSTKEAETHTAPTSVTRQVAPAAPRVRPRPDQMVAHSDVNAHSWG